jgi:hypothetical protein
MATLAKLLNWTAGDSAEHRAIQEELRGRAINNAPDTATHLRFTAEEWSRTLQRNVAKLGRAPGSGRVLVPLESPRFIGKTAFAHYPKIPENSSGGAKISANGLTNDLLRAA